MRQFIKLFVFGILFVGGGVLPGDVFAQEKFKPKYLREDDKGFRALTSYTSESGWIDFRKDKEPIDPDTFYEKFGKTIGLGNEYQMRLISDETDFKENRHQHYQLYWKDVPVEYTHS